MKTGTDKEAFNTTLAMIGSKGVVASLSGNVASLRRGVLPVRAIGPVKK